MIKKISRAAVCMLLCVCVMLTSFPLVTDAITKTLTVSQAISLALSFDKTYKQQKAQLSLKKIKYQQAVDSVRKKWKTFGTFQWKPLLSFKFPEYPYMDEEFELVMKAPMIDAEIDLLLKQMSDRRIEVTEKINNKYIEAYVLQRKIAFNEERYNAQKQTLERNKLREIDGTGKKEDVEKIESTISALKTELSGQKKQYLTALESISSMIGINVTSGYVLENCLETVDLDRGLLDGFIQSTLNKDISVYQAKAQYETAQSNLDEYISLYRNSYGGKVDYVINDVMNAYKGADIDFDSFKARYDSMLADIENPWKGKKRILFFKFPKEWFMGKLTATRYIENEMYALYVATKELSDAKMSYDKTVSTVTESVKSQFETLKTSYTTYTTMLDINDTAKTFLDGQKARNLLGDATFEEVSDAQEAYETAQLDALSTLGDYTMLLVSFDRLTCAAVTPYRQKGSMSLESTEGGDSYADMEDLSKPYYYLDITVTNMKFEFGLHIPEDYEPEIEEYELWYGKNQVGQRTAADKTITHMPLTYGEEDKLMLRVYSGGEFIDEVEINTAIIRDYIEFKNVRDTVTEEPTQTVLGAYTVKIGELSQLTTLSFDFTKDAGQNAAFYSLVAEDQTLLNEELKPITESFSYLSFGLLDMTKLTARFYDENEKLLYTGSFDAVSGKVIRQETEANGNG